MGDFSKSMSQFEELKKSIDKSKKALEEDKNQLPVFVLSAFMKCEDTVNEAWPARKKLNKIQSQELTKLRQRLKKYREERPDFSDQFDVYRENPVIEEAEPEPESESEESESSVDAAPVKTSEFLKKAAGKKPGNKFGPIGANLDSDAESDESESESEEESESESDSESGDTDESSEETESSEEESTDEETDEDESDESEDSVNWGSDTDSDASDDEIEYKAGDWRLFLKKTEEEEAEEKRKEKEKREEEKRVKLAERDERRKAKQAVKKEREADGGEWETVDGSTGTRFIEIFATGET